ncbi:MAG: carbamoyl transferase, partial [Candidatus Dadabacteria bacterium]|nr:carbamoyl transferase [Candidatus Dadabacteria bacterium]
HNLKNPKKEVMRHNYYGPDFSNQEIRKALDGYKLTYRYVKNIEKVTAALLAEGKIIGWFQGRMEFGQRALGNRSILADPRSESMKDELNARIKFREWFRPFAPAILKEHLEEFFQVEKHTERVPFMERVLDFRPDKKSIVPAVVHVDGTGRVQTVEKEENPKFYKLIFEFERITGVPIVVNTSFNLNGEPIVC